MPFSIELQYSLSGEIPVSNSTGISGKRRSHDTGTVFKACKSYVNPKKRLDNIPSGYI